MVSYGKRKLLILQVTKCSLPSASTKRDECSTLCRLCSSICWIRHVNYGFIILSSEKVTIRCLKILSIFKAGPQQRADFHPELFNPYVLVVGFDLYCCLFRGLQFFFLTWKNTDIQRPFWKANTDTSIWFRPLNFLCAVKCVIYSIWPSKKLIRVQEWWDRLILYKFCRVVLFREIQLFPWPLAWLK